MFNWIRSLIRLINEKFSFKDEHEDKPGEDFQYIEKHVEFTDDLNNEEENAKDHHMQQKLHRRDTPHHLKNKRIITKNTDGITLDVNIFKFSKIDLIRVLFFSF